MHRLIRVGPNAQTGRAEDQRRRIKSPLVYCHRLVELARQPRDLPLPLILVGIGIVRLKHLRGVAADALLRHSELEAIVNMTVKLEVVTALAGGLDRGHPQLRLVSGGSSAGPRYPEKRAGNTHALEHLGDHLELVHGALPRR